MTASVIVLVCSARQSGASEELLFAEQELLRDLSAVPVQYVETPDGTAFSKARYAVDALAVPDEVTVIFLAHGALWLTPGAVAAMFEWCGRKQPAIGMVPDARVPGLGLSPEYLTLYGFENFAARLAKTLLPSPPHGFQPLVFACAAGLLRGGANLAGCSIGFVPGTFAHDFSGYHRSDRCEMLRLLPHDCATVLDVGGGEGRFLELVKTQRGCETHLAEFADHACALARKRVDHVWQGDFLATRFDRRFDCICFLDVLEHTTAPSSWLDRARSLLSPGGALLLSIPNVGHWSVIADLMSGRWDYVPAGIHCITHLRFFTRRGIEQLVENAGFYCEVIEPVVIPTPDGFPCADLDGVLVCDRASMNAYAYHVRARVKA